MLVSDYCCCVSKIQETPTLSIASFNRLGALDLVLDAILLHLSLVRASPPDWSSEFTLQREIGASFACGVALITLLPSKAAGKATWNWRLLVLPWSNRYHIGMRLPLRDRLWVLPDGLGEAFSPDCALEGPAADEGPAAAPLVVVFLLGAIFAFIEYSLNSR